VQHGLHDVAMHIVGVRSVDVSNVSVYCMGVHGTDVPGVGVHKTRNFFSGENYYIFDAHLRKKLLTSYYMSLNNFCKLKDA
jgi:hypothetical protein